MATNVPGSNDTLCQFKGCDRRAEFSYLPSCGTSPLSVAYADPPYLGSAQKIYGRHHPEAAEWDNPETHRALIQRLQHDYPNGWALSCQSNNLRILLPMCPERVRVAAWVKPFHAYKRGVRPAYAWEPLLFAGGRNLNHPPPEKNGKATTPKDFVAANITLKRGLTGAKPAAFCYWMFNLLGLRPGDEFADLFPGTGAVGVAWREFCSQPELRMSPKVVA